MFFYAIYSTNLLKNLCNTCVTDATHDYNIDRSSERSPLGSRSYRIAYGHSDGSMVKTTTNITATISLLMLVTRFLSNRTAHSLLVIHPLKPTTSFIHKSILNMSTSPQPTNEVDKTKDYSDIVLNLKDVNTRIKNQMIKSKRDEDDVRLVAVSKTKPIEMVQVAYEVRNLI